MRILIDECLDWRLSRALPGHEAVSVSKLRWRGFKNGRLLAMAMENGFAVFLTGDRNLTFQQNLSEYAIAIVVLEAAGTQLHQTVPLMEKVLAMLPTLKPGMVVRVSI